MGDLWKRLSAMGKTAILSLAAAVSVVALFVSNWGNIRSGVIEHFFDQPKLSIDGARLGRMTKSAVGDHSIAILEGTVFKDGRNPATGCLAEVRFPKRPLSARMMDGTEVHKFDMGYGSQSKRLWGLMHIPAITAINYASDYRDGKVGKPQAQVRCGKASSAWVEVEY